MAIAESLGTFLEDFGVTVVTGAVTALGILDSPTDDSAGGGMVLSNEYRLTGRTDQLGTVQDGDTMAIDGEVYMARSDATLLSDGVFCEISLTLVAPETVVEVANPDSVDLVFDGDFL